MRKKTEKRISRILIWGIWFLVFVFIVEFILLIASSERY